MDKKSNKGFIKAFYQLPACELNNVQVEIMKKCGWSAGNFTSKRNGNRNISPEEWKKLKKIFEKYNIEVSQ